MNTSRTCLPHFGVFKGGHAPRTITVLSWEGALEDSPLHGGRPPSDGVPAMATEQEASFGALLRQYRVTAGLSQAALAERAGVSAHAISDLERGARRTPYRYTVEQLVAALGLEREERARLEAAVQRRRRPAPAASPTAARPTTNLPVPLTSFIGREQEVAEVQRLLGTTRLLTLTGAGGVGKSRLALQVAAAVQAEYPDGVWLVELAALANPALVPQAVARILTVQEQAGRPLIETLTHWLAGKRLLLVLDNCEHLIEACADLADALLRQCPRLQILATSREPLGMAGETAWRVPSLTLPEPRLRPPLEDLSRYEAVRLFLERARAVRPGFALTAQNAAAVGQVCQRLDGMPLAIELAAARVPVLTVEELAVRLDDRFRLLVGGSRTALPRHQTLRATLDWSYRLLEERERVLLRRLAVFAGGWTLVAVEAVCSGDGINAGDVLDLLTRLVDKSLVLLETGTGGTTRYRLLETVRQYAGERLAEAEEEQRVRARHRDWCLALAEQAEPHFLAAEQLVWLARLEAEEDNLRAALAWCEAHDRDAGLRLAGRLWPFWWVQGHHQGEGRWWLAAFLQTPAAEPANAPTSDRARALLGAAVLGNAQGDNTHTMELLEEALAVAQAVGDRQLVARVWVHLSAAPQGASNRDQVRATTTEALAHARAAGDAWGTGHVLWWSSLLLLRDGQTARARTVAEEALTMLRSVGDRGMISTLLIQLGRVALVQGEIEPARAWFAEALAVGQDLRSPGCTARAQRWLGRAAYWAGELDRAVDHYEASVALERERGAQNEAAIGLAFLGLAVQARGEAGRARALAEDSLTLAAALGMTIDPATVARAAGMVLLGTGEVARGAALLRESLATCWRVGARWEMAECLEGLAASAVAAGQPLRAIRLLGAAAALREALGAPVPPVERPGHEATVQAARTALGEEAFLAAWAEGQALSVEQVVAEALTEEATGEV